MHGDVALTVEDGLLVIRGLGPANIEAVFTYQRTAQKYREQLNHQPWASLVLLRGEPLLPPAAKSLLIDTIQYACTQQLVATAIVLQDVAYENVVRLFWESIYNQTELPYQFFHQEAEARDWLYEQIEQAKA
ncbi:hypothetical protein [Alteromonas flava]|uniref:hypothetical protein n=1 Tax=Alteromonas flava TaxID=2048003 RepID=UPI001F0CAC89|nr:hypothetical protein [Alteromonas flava]